MHLKDTGQDYLREACTLLTHSPAGNRGQVVGQLPELLIKLEATKSVEDTFEDHPLQLVRRFRAHSAQEVLKPELFGSGCPVSTCLIVCGYQETLEVRDVLVQLGDIVLDERIRGLEVR